MEEIMKIKELSLALVIQAAGSKNELQIWETKFFDHGQTVILPSTGARIGRSTVHGQSVYFLRGEQDQIKRTLATLKQGIRGL